MAPKLLKFKYLNADFAAAEFT